MIKSNTCGFVKEGDLTHVKLLVNYEPMLSDDRIKQKNPFCEPLSSLKPPSPPSHRARDNTVSLFS